MQGFDKLTEDEGADETVGLQDPTVADVCAVVIEPKTDWRVFLLVRVRAQMSPDFRSDLIQFMDLVRRFGITISPSAESLYRELTGHEERH